MAATGALAGTGLSMPSIGMDQVMMWFWWGLLFALLLGGGIFLIIYMKYKYKVIIFEKRANNITKVLLDRARIDRVNNTNSLKLWKLRYRIPLLDGQKYTFIKGKKDIYFFNKIDDDHILPITTISDPDSAKFKTIPQDLKFWLFEQWRRTESIYGEDSFWKKNMGTIVGLAGIAMVLVLVIIILGQFNDVNTGLMEVANAINSWKPAQIVPGG